MTHISNPNSSYIYNLNWSPTLVYIVLKPLLVQNQVGKDFFFHYIQSYMYNWTYLYSFIATNISHINWNACCVLSQSRGVEQSAGPTTVHGEIVFSQPRRLLCYHSATGVTDCYTAADWISHSWVKFSPYDIFIYI